MHTRHLVLGVLLGCFAAGGSSARELEALAYNVLYNSEEDAASLSLIEREQPDVLCLRELTPRFASAFTRKLKGALPHQALFPRKGTWGVGLASRFPLRNVRRFPQAPHRIPALEADVLVEGRRVRVVCVHFMPPVAKHTKSETLPESMRKNAVLREAQAHAHVERLTKVDGPLLILGDMNEGARDAALRTFYAAGLQRACEVAPEASCGPTWPGDSSPWPALFEIDHILGRGLTFTEAAVVRGGGSDHFAVRARFRLPP